MFLIILYTFLATTQTVVANPVNPNQITFFSNVATVSLLQDLQYSRKFTDMVCTLRLYFGNGSVAFNISQILENYEPFELYQKDVRFHTLHPPEHKFRSCCWSTVYTVEYPDEEILRRKQLGNAIYDQFILYSENQSVLEEAMNNARVIDKAAIKYGMFLEIADKARVKVKYLLEPKVYTGSFKVSGNLKTPKMFNNLNGRELKVPVFSVTPIFVVERDKHGKVAGYRGSHYDFIMELSRRANFTIKFYGEDLPVGEKLENGTWTGFSGEMINGHGDLCPIGGTIAETYNFMTFTTLSYRETMTFCLNEPEPKLHWQALVFPLSPTVWVFTLTSFGTFILLFSAIVTCRLVQRSAFSMPMFLEEGVFLPFALFLEQNVRIPAKGSARIAALSLIWLALVVATVYKTHLVGFLTFPEKQVIPRTFKQLHQHEEYTLNLFSFSSLEMGILKSSPRPVFKGIVKRINLVSSMETCLKSATKDKTACIIWKYLGTGEAMKHLATFPQLKSLYFSQDNAAVVDIATSLKKHSIHYETVNRYTAATKESGLFSKWMKYQMALERDMGFQAAAETDPNGDDGNNNYRRETEVEFYDDDDNVKENEHSVEKPLRLKNLVAVAYAFAFGCGISFICLAAELLINLFVYYASNVVHVFDIDTMELT